MFEVIGYEMISYTSKATGELVQGCRLYVTADFDGVGKRCEAVFMRSSVLGSYVPAVGDIIFIQRDGRGYVQGIYKP